MNHFLWFVLFIWWALAAVLSAEERSWTNAEGTASFEGRFIEIRDNSVVIERTIDQRRFSLDLSELSIADQAWVEEHRQEQERAAEAASSTPERLDWPRHLRVGSDYSIEVIEEDRSANRFVYRSNHFEFVSDVPLSRRVIREFGLIFEATYLAVEAMPLAWEPRPPEGTHFQVRLFGERAAYHAAGGPPNSGGVYIGRRREILVPLTTVGMRRTSSEYTFDPNANFNVLIHEVTHQVHHHWLRRLPIWLTEGLAVYMESVPYRGGDFRFDRRNLSESFRRRSRENTFIPLDRMLEITNREWLQTLAQDPEYSHLHYATSLLMAEFFFHHDDDGRRLFAYLRAIEAGKPEAEARKILLNDRSIEELTEEFIRAHGRNRLRLSPLER